MDATWFSAIAQTGAMGILAYHFLVGLPAILERISKEQAQERLFWEAQNEKDRAEFARRAEMIQAELRAILMYVFKERQENHQQHPPGG